MEKRYAVVQQADFRKYKRVIVISDIHGDSAGLAGVLKKVEFSGEDALVIAGDMVERGKHSLEVLRMVMKYQTAGNVFAVLGNNDSLLLEWLDGEIPDKAMLGYVTARDTGVIREMAQELGMPFHSLEQFVELKQAVKRTFAREIQFLRNLALIIDSELAVFVHAGIEPGDLQKQDYEFCLAAPAFARQKHRFEKPVIVGHWPTSNYCDTKIDVNVYYNKETNVISMDGGNSMKSWAQINYLILIPEGLGTWQQDDECLDGGEERKQGSQCPDSLSKQKPGDTGIRKFTEIHTGYYDCLPKIRALEPQSETPEAFTLVFPNTQIEIRSKADRESVCFVPYINKEITVPNERIYEYKNRMYCYDFTTYDLAVEPGEVLAFCAGMQDGILVKRDGIVGNYRGKFEYLTEANVL